MHLVTGYKGEEHIMSADQGSFNASFFGTGQHVMEAGSKLEVAIIDNNTVRIYDGDLLMYGRHVRIEPNTYEDLTIQTGTAGANRYDIICATYSKNTNDGTEDSYLQVIRGTESERVPDLPAYTDGNILEGATFNQMPLYKVVIEGVVLKEVVPMFTTIPTYQALAERYAQEFQKSCETHLDSLNVYDTMEEIEANTQENQLAGALAVKELMQRVNDIDLSANRVTYDNTISKLKATTTQGAIDEINQSLTLDFSKSTMTSLNEFLQSALEKLYPLLEPLYIIKAGADKNGINIYKGTEQAQLSASVTFGTSYATLKTAYDSIMCVTSLVDFKGYKTLNITFQGAGHSTTKNEVRIGVSTSKTDGVMEKTLYSASNYTNIDKITKSIDVSDISGEKYVSIYMSNTRTNAGEDKIYIYDLWLE